MKATVGMATYNDHQGVWATIQSLRMHHGEAGRSCEILVVDNNPRGPHAEQNANLCRWVTGTGQPCRHIPYDGVTGTSAPRDMVFREATGDFVVCMDSHILLWPGAVERLLAWAEKNQANKDLVTGPMVYDGLTTFSTHFDDVWRGQMWGILAQAWQCECGFRFSPTPSADGKTVGFLHLTPPQNAAAFCACGKSWPTLGWSGHETELEKLGYKRLGASIDGSPFEIPAMGLGVFGCRKDAWLGFNDKFRGFGGEEWYIHEKFRQAGRKCLSLPFMRWVHRFGRPDGVPYPLALWHRVRNYVIGHHELGLPLDRIRDHFPESVMPYQEWAQLAANPSNPPEWPTGPQVQPPPGNCNGCGEAEPASATLDKIGVNTVHLRSYVEKCDHVADSRTAKGVRHLGTDLLFIGNCKSRSELSTELVLNALKSRRFIAIHGSDDQGMISAVDNFLHHEHQWRVIGRWPQDGGLAVLSRNQDDWPEEPYFVAPPASGGPGTELKALLAELGITPPAGCDCNSKARLMDQMSVRGCEGNFDTVVGWLKEGQERWGWSGTLGAGWKAVTSGLVWTIGITDPVAGLVREAIRRAKITINAAKKAGSYPYDYQAAQQPYEV